MDDALQIAFMKIDSHEFHELTRINIVQKKFVLIREIRGNQTLSFTKVEYDTQKE